MAKKSYRRSRLRSLLETMRRWWKPRPGSRPEPEDPYAYRMAPVRRGPKDRSGAAVAELEE
jgi:hypothetical protein